MSKDQFYQQTFPFNQPSGTVSNFNYPNLTATTTATQQEESDVTKSNEIRRDNTQYYVEQLYKLTFVQRHGERNALRTGGRKNKNEILALTLALLVKEKYLNGRMFLRDLELIRGIQTRLNTSDFIMVLRTDGRIVAISDEVEQHLGKSMRSIYAQCINMYECLDSTDDAKLEAVLRRANDLVPVEHKLVCTFRLPKGKRPSRAREDIKAITMTGHFYSCHDSITGSDEKLFIARCETLLSQTTSSSSSSASTSTINPNDNATSMIKLELNEDMSISFASQNVKDILGYSRNEMIGNWIGRYLTNDALNKFESIREKYLNSSQEQQTAVHICEIFDIYGNNGENRLTFLCQIRPRRERRSKIVKVSIVAQLIDPSLINEYVKYVQIKSDTPVQSVKAEQVNHVPSIPKTSEDAIVAHSPTLDMGILADHFDFSAYHQYSPIQRSMSNVVAPFNQHDESWTDFIEFDFPEYSAASNEFASWPKSTDENIFDCQPENLTDLFADFLDSL